MSRTRERHLFVEIAAEVSGGLLVVSVYQHSWIVGLAGIALGLAVYLVDKFSIKQEEKLETLEYVAGVMKNATGESLVRQSSSEPNRTARTQ